MSRADVIGISFDRMDAAKRKINKALDAANAELDDLSKAAGSLQVYDGRLVQKAGALDSMRNSINSRINGLQQMNAHIDYAVRMFKETDELCAQRMRGEAYEIKKTLGLARSGGIFGGIVGGLISIVIIAEAAWNWVNKDNKKNLYVPKVGFSNRGYIPGLGQAALIAGGTLNTGKFVIEGMKAVKGVSVDAKGTANLPPWGYNGAPPAGWTGPWTSNSSDTKGTSNSPASAPSTEEKVNDRIISNLRKYDGFGYKKDAIIKAAEALLSEGYEPAFVAGLLANIAKEGSPGVLEKSNYGSFKLLSNDKEKGRYLDYEDSSNYKKKGAYLIYMDKYMNYSKNFSGKTISEVGLDKLNDLYERMKMEGAHSVVAGKWKDGKFLGYYDKQTNGGFGTGMIQWTFDRAKGLLDYYNTKKFIKDGFPNQEECLETEIEYMIKELKSDPYKGIYGDGKQYDGSNKDAAYNAGYNICHDYEKPSGGKESADERGTYAKEVYKIMMGGK